MATDTVTTFQKPLKTFFGPNMARAIAQKVYFLTRAKNKSNTIKWGGRDSTMEFPAHKKRGWSTAAHSEAGGAATPRSPGFGSYQVGIAGLNCTFEVSDRLVQSTRARPDLSYVGSVLKFEMTELMLTAEKLLGIQVHGDGTGTLAQVSEDDAAITATTFRVNNPGVQWMEVGMFLEAHTNKSGSESNQFSGGAQEIGALDRDIDEVTVTSTTGLADNDWVFLYGHYNLTNMNGLYGIVDDGTVQSTFQGVDRTAAGNGFAKAWRRDANDAMLNESTVFDAFAELYMRAPTKGVGDWADEIVTDFESYKWLALSVLDRQRFAGTSISGGVSNLKYDTPWGNKTVTIDALAWPHEMSLCRMADFFFGWLGAEGGHWFDEDGQMLRPKIDSSSGTGYAKAWVAEWIMEVQFGCENPMNQLRLTGYTST